jgi:hypothetical protein
VYGIFHNLLAITEPIVPKGSKNHEVIARELREGGGLVINNFAGINGVWVAQCAGLRSLWTSTL